MRLRPWPAGPADCPPWRCLGCGVRRRCQGTGRRARYSLPPAVDWRSADNTPPARGSRIRPGRGPSGVTDRALALRRLTRCRRVITSCRCRDLHLPWASLSISRVISRPDVPARAGRPPSPVRRRQGLIADLTLMPRNAGQTATFCPVDVGRRRGSICPVPDDSGEDPLPRRSASPPSLRRDAHPGTRRSAYEGSRTMRSPAALGD